MEEQIISIIELLIKSGVIDKKVLGILQKKFPLLLVVTLVGTVVATVVKNSMEDKGSKEYLDSVKKIDEFLKIDESTINELHSKGLRPVYLTMYKYSLKEVVSDSVALDRLRSEASSFLESDVVLSEETTRDLYQLVAYSDTAKGIDKVDLPVEGGINTMSKILDDVTSNVNLVAKVLAATIKDTEE